MEESRQSGDGEEDVRQKPVISKSDLKIDEKLLAELLSLGLDVNTAKKAIYHTGSVNVEKCFDFIYSNPNPLELSNTTLEYDLGLEGVCSAIDTELNLNEQSNEDYKMVFVINTKLNMSLGKSCSQVAHAAMDMNNEVIRENHVRGYQNWLITGQRKIVLDLGNENLDTLKAKASALNLANVLIQDAGLTEIASGSKTVLAIFGPITQVDKVTGNLRLLK